ncbi:MAG: NAD(P)/FAD-dependent oxidoreductase, partial [Sphingomonadales bacterium]
MGISPSKFSLGPPRCWKTTKSYVWRALFRSRAAWRAWPSTSLRETMVEAVQNKPKSEMKFLVIGAGMAGILMGIRLKQAGYSDYLVVEMGDKVGGTWRANHYPGLHCDVPSHHYCYSFEPYAEWSEVFSCGPEIRDYLEHSAVKYGVMPNIRFNTAARTATWDGARWTVELSTGETV